ncbi:MAG: glucuronate isomerase, partial [Clostridia bacterium]|nr:glucuronate isomerase [Clostridia bacterium]
MFFDENLLLYNECGKKLYNEVKDLPIIDYHCHLDPKKIADDDGFSDIGELWLSGDHYKWRAMRLNGVDEYYITGKASYREKFFKYAEILPNLIGNPLYYWTHLELKQIFGIDIPLNKDTAEEIYNKANEILKNTTIHTLLGDFKVEFVATTDDPIDSLEYHGKQKDTLVTPTFRPDKLFDFADDYIEKLSKASGITIVTLDNLLDALSNRLDFFVSKGCRMADHGMDTFPASYADKATAERLF